MHGQKNITLRFYMHIIKLLYAHCQVMTYSR